MKVPIVPNSDDFTNLKNKKILLLFKINNINLEERNLKTL